MPYSAWDSGDAQKVFSTSVSVDYESGNAIRVDRATKIGQIGLFEKCLRSHVMLLKEKQKSRLETYKKKPENRYLNGILFSIRLGRCLVNS